MTPLVMWSTLTLSRSTVDLTGPTATITDAKVPSVGGTSINDGATTGFGLYSIYIREFRC